MPAKNTIKKYGSQQVWHIYNRGNNKRDIFIDDTDYKVFLSYIKCALSDDIDEETRKSASSYLDVERIRRMRLNEEVQLLSYCLMPNHYHLMLYQESRDGISKLMRSIMTGYVMYFNKKHEGSGSLFQGVYKGSEIKSISYWDHISRYIHLNAVDVSDDYKTYDYSSYKYYVGAYSMPNWLKPGIVLDGFKAPKEYESFCDQYLERKLDLSAVKQMLADT